VDPYRAVREGELVRSHGLFVAEGRLVVRRVLQDRRSETLAGIAEYEVHRGCLALVHRPPPTALDDILANAKLAVVLEGVTNADNVGGIFRNAAAFGAGGVLLSPTSCDPSLSSVGFRVSPS
jgi:tRNA G18 (ribose-2'-O)-methylase SpoU